MNSKYALLVSAALVAVLLVACGTAAPAPQVITVAATATATEIPATAGPTTAVAAAPLVVGLPPGEPAPFPNINFLKMVDEANGWALDTDGQLYRTADGGLTWYLLKTPADLQFSAYGSAFLDAAHAWLPYYDSNGQPALLRTTDGGLTWTPLTNIGLGQAGGEAGFRFSSPDEGIAEVAGVGAGNLYIQDFETHDGGASFQVIPLVGPTDEQGLPQGTVHLCNLCMDAFHYDPSRTIIVEGDMGTMEARGKLHLKQSTDLGQNWTESVLPLPSGYEEALVGGLPLSLLDKENGFLPVRLMKYNPDGTTAFDMIAVYVTADGGATWSLAPHVLSGVTNPATLQFLNPLEGAALCGSTVCVTHDGAQTWQTITPDVDLSSTDTRYVLSMTFATPEAGWIILSEDDGFHLYRTTDSGATWTLLNK